MKKWLPGILLIAGALWFWQPWNSKPEGAGRERKIQAVPVEVAPLTRGPIEQQRTFSGTLEARAAFVIAAPSWRPPASAWATPRSLPTRLFYPLSA